MSVFAEVTAVESSNSLSEVDAEKEALHQKDQGKINNVNNQSEEVHGNYTELKHLETNQLDESGLISNSQENASNKKVFED